MKRHTILALVTIAMLALPAFAQLPPGKWWRRPEIVESLALTADQQSKLDEVFRGSANELIDLKGEVEKQTIALRGELDQPALNRASIQKVASRLNDARGRLFSRELAMFTDMRNVLNAQQWDHMRSQLDQIGEKRGARPDGPRKMNNGRGMNGRGMNRPQGRGQGAPPPPGQ